MECYSCYSIAAFYFTVGVRIDSPPEQNEKVISPCCRFDLKKDVDGSDMDFPATPLFETPEKTLENYMAMRARVIAKGTFYGDSRDKKFACHHCKDWVKANWNISPFITYVNLSIYPSPCQSRCCYCSVGRTNQSINDYALEAYEKIFDTLELARKQELIAPRGVAMYQVSSGEITIHPLKDRIMKLVKGEKVCFYTNGFIFDEDIARELHDNPLSSLNISIDSGTPETWHKVKGVNNFVKVRENLMQYAKSCCHSNQITVKYIVLPGINDDYEDFMSCTQFLKKLKVPNLAISRDLKVLCDKDKREQSCAGEILDETDVISAAKLVAICVMEKINPGVDQNYTGKEKEKIFITAQEIFKSLNR